MLGIVGFIFKGYIGLVFLVTLLIFYFPILILLQKEKWKKKSFKVHVAWSWSVRILLGVFVKYPEKAELPEGPYIIIANHSSYLDIFLMYSLFPKYPFLFLGKSEILNYPLVKTLFKRLNIPVFRNDRLKAAKSFIQAKNAVKQGWGLIIFPEGTIPDENWPQMIPFKDGAFKLAKNCKVPLVPITFTRNYKLFSDPECLLGEAHPGISEVYIHPYISVEEIEQLTVEELSKVAYAIIEKPLLPYYKKNP